MVQKLYDHNPLNVFLEGSAVLEIRMENDGNGNPIFVGFAQAPNLGTAVEQWFIVKIDYDGNSSPIRYRLPDSGVVFQYAWDDRSTYFAA